MFAGGKFPNYKWKNCLDKNICRGQFSEWVPGSSHLGEHLCLGSPSPRVPSLPQVMMILLVIMLRMMEVVILKWWRFSNKINLKPKHKQAYQLSFMLFGHVWYIVDGRLCNTLMLQSFPHGIWVTLFGEKDWLHGIGKKYLYLHYSNNIS